MEKIDGNWLRKILADTKPLKKETAPIKLISQIQLISYRQHIYPELLEVRTARNLETHLPFIYLKKAYDVKKWY